ncbi:MAG: glycerophosphodiester phosphodiesterase [Chloroflexota bacterium]
MDLIKQRLPADSLAADKGLIVFAHRGGGGCWPENTMLAFANAVALGVDALETDIQRSVDGHLVMIHDPFVDRVTEGSGRVADMTLAQLQRLDAGYRWTRDGLTFPFRGQGLRIPTLAELFDAFPHIWINVDIKQHETAVVDQFAAMIEQYEMADRMMVGSFDEATVWRFRRVCPQVKTAASLSEVARLLLLSRLGLSRWFRSPATSLQIPERHGLLPLVTPALVRAAQRHQIGVHVWTVDDYAAMKRLIARGVDGLMTDYPERLLRLLGRK